jgi:6-pyruvoyltetrahydropterin/6-carboxytetrahydropterin synthase
MILTANRRFVFAASRRLSRDGWPPAENQRVYGTGSEGRWGSGENFEAHFVFQGELNPHTGMLVNLSTIKELLNAFVERRYDHRFVNVDTPPFDRRPPTAENLARQLLAEAEQATSHLAARPVACHLAEFDGAGATAWASGKVERELWLSFSAARRTASPRLSDEENAELFGRASSPAGHGHGYRLRVTLGGPVDEASGLVAPHDRTSRAMTALHQMLDHRNLSVEVPDLAGEPMTTECLARWVHRRLSEDLPVARVRLYEMPEFFAEFDGRRTGLGLQRTFSAAHTLRNARFTDEENRKVFGKCSNPNGHGHRYTVQATLAGRLDERTGTVFSLTRFGETMAETLGAWDRHHLDIEIEDFRDSPSTGENIVKALWPRLDASLDGKLARLRLFETENNRFTLRRR